MLDSKLKVMTRTILYLKVLLLVFLTSCDKSLELEPISSISTQSFWKSEEDAESAVIGAYNSYRASFGLNLLYWGEFRSGFWTFASGTSQIGNLELWANTLTRNSHGADWTSLYTLINNCNLILKYVPTIDFVNQRRKDEVLGHAYFLRAAAYFWIVRIWGDAPKAIDGFESAGQELYLSRVPAAELYELVREDIGHAVELLPESNFAAQPVLASSAAANMLKADLYLWTAKVQNGGQEHLEIAREAVDKVLASNHRLENSYERVFRDENSNEIIFSIYHDHIEGAANIGNQFLLRMIDVPAGARDTIPYNTTPQQFKLSNYFVDNVLNATSVDSRTRTIWREVAFSPTLKGSWVNKYLGTIVEGTRQFTDDIRIYRFAEAIFFKAEIENALGNSDIALAALNQAVKRAYGVENYYVLPMAKQQIDEIILNERLIEFAAEGKSWFDILRFGRAFEMIETLKGREGQYRGNVLFFPVNQDIINRNFNVKQTIGYE